MKILVGEIKKPHGVHGEVLVEPLSENPARFDPGSELLVGKAPESAQARVVEVSRRVPAGILVRFQGDADREAAAAIRGLLIFVDESEIGDPSPGGWWEHQLVGADVLDSRRHKIGEIVAVHIRQEQDLWEMETGEEKVFIPATKEIVSSVDVERGEVVVDLPPGFLPEDEA